MKDFFTWQMDYVYFFYGLASVGLAVVCYVMMRKKPQPLPWIWLALFGIFHSAHDWMEAIARGLWDNRLVNVSHVLLMTISFILLLEFGRAGVRGISGKGPGRWIFFPLLLLSFLGGFTGLDGFDAAARYSLGLTGGLWAAMALLLASGRFKKAAGRWLVVCSTAAVIYSLATGIGVPPAPFIPASLLNRDFFFQTFGVPVQLIRGICLTVMASSIWVSSQLLSRETGTFTYPKGVFRPAIILIMVVITGWGITEFAGNVAQKEEMREGRLTLDVLRNYFVSEVKGAVHDAVRKASDPEVRAALVSGRPADIDAVRTLLDCKGTHSEDLRSSYLIDNKGRVVAGCREGGASAEMSFKGRKYVLQNALSGKTAGNYFFDSGKRDWSYYAYADVEDAGGRVIGVVISERKLKGVEEAFKRYPFCFLIDPNGVVFISSNEEFCLKTLWPLPGDVRKVLVDSGQFGPGPFNPLMSSEAVDGKFITFAGQDLLVSRQFVNDNGWSLVLLNPLGHIRAYRFFAIFAIFVFCSMTGGFFGLLYFTRESAAQILTSERRYRSLVEGSTNCVVLFDGEGRCMAINKSGLDLIGCREEEIVGKRFDRFRMREMGRSIDELFMDVLQGNRHSFEAEGIRADGKRAIWNAVLNPVLDADGHIRSFVGIFMDITERIEARDELRRYHEHLEEMVRERTVELSEANKQLNQLNEALGNSEERFRSLFNLASDCILLIDAGNGVPVIADANIAACVMNGYARDELIGMPLIALDHEDSREQVPQIMEHIMSGEAATFEIDHVRKDGSVFPVEVSAQLIYLSGRPYILAIDRDITERRKNEEELKRHREHLLEMVEERTVELKTAVQLLTSEINFRKMTEETLKESEIKFRRLSQEFHTLLDAMPDTLILLSRDLTVMWANSTAATLFGRQSSEATGHHCFEMWYNRCEPCEDCFVLRSFDSGNSESSQRTTSSGRLLDGRAFPIKGEDGVVNSVIVVLTDVTEKTALQAEAMRASHLASLGELAAGVAHEINNPINGIINYAQILANKITAGSKESEISQRIIREGDRIAGIVRSLLSFARERKEDRVPVAMQRIIEDTVTLTETQIRKDGIDLLIDIPDRLPEIVANPQQIQQVFLNVISNARYALNQKYPGTHAEKKFVISGERVMVDDSPYVRTVFYDMGTGISADIMDKVMHPFFSTKPSGMGTGLGLSISHGIIKSHGGRLSLESAEGAYTKVTIDLPVKERHGK